MSPAMPLHRVRVTARRMMVATAIVVWILACSTYLIAGLTRPHDAYWHWNMIDALAKLTLANVLLCPFAFILWASISGLSDAVRRGEGELIAPDPPEPE